MARTKINVLSPGFVTANSQGLLYPLVANHHLLQEQNLDVSVHQNLSGSVADCDYLIIDSKYFKNDWKRERTRVIDTIACLSERIGNVLWFHTGDSAGALGSYCNAILPYVLGIYKNQIYSDKRLYQSPLYGNRLYTDYYHREFGIDDENKPDADDSISTKDLSKLRVSWNIGYARCFHYYGELVSKLYRYAPWPPILKIQPKMHCATIDRVQGIYSRMGMNFPRRTVGFQREKLAEYLGYQPRVSRRIYYKEMKDSKIVVSPFGWGEINNRDFEAFIYGCLLVKPTVGHIETYPPLFVEQETYIPYKWDFSDMVDSLREVEENYKKYREIAVEGQESYVKSVISSHGREKFAKYFAELIRTAPA